MNRTLKRTLALALALIFTFMLAVSALAENSTPDPSPEVTATPAPGAPASADSITITVSGATISATHIYIPVTVMNASGEAVTLESVYNKTAGESVGSDASSPLPMTIPANSSREVLLTDTHNGSNSGTVTRTLVFSFKPDSGSSFTKYQNVSVDFGVDVNGGGSNEGNTTEAVDPAFRLS